MSERIARRRSGLVGVARSVSFPGPHLRYSCPPLLHPYIAPLLLGASASDRVSRASRALPLQRLAA